MLIRPATLDDTEARVQVHNASRPDNQITLETALHSEKVRKPELVFQRFAAEIDGEPVAFAYYSQLEWMFHPQKFDMGVLVHPDYRKRGIGSALYDTLIENLESYDPIKFIAFAREDWKDSVKFAEERGFEVEFREWESRLNMATFDANKFAGSLEKVEALGYKLCSLADLADDIEAFRKVYELDLETSQDIPLPPGESFTFPAFERWLETVQNRPGFQAESWFVAVTPDGEVVGVSMLFKRTADHELDTGLTGVKRAHRRKGIALALKLKGLEYARKYGAPVVRTFNAQNNQQMLPINERLGFVKQPGWLGYAKKLKSD
jgi:mycothiol synthase